MSPDTLPSSRLRLQKFLSQQGISSRRAAEQLILDKKVLVNGAIAHIGQSIDPEQDRVEVNRVLVSSAKRRPIVLAMNKPKGYITSRGDPNFPAPTVFDLLPRAYQKEHLFCIGRLDKDSEGLLLFTNDGALAQKLAHPSSGVIKRYHVTLHRPFDEKDLQPMLKGIWDEGEHLSAKRIWTYGHTSDGKSIEVHLQQGKKREIRRLVEAFGYFVKRLKRFQIGQFVMKKIPSGAIRKLSDREIAALLKQGGQEKPFSSNSYED